MINISTEAILNGLLVDHIARTIIPTTIGVSTGNGTIMHFEDTITPADQTKANAVLANYGGLTVNADKTTMTEGDADPVITVDTGIGASEAVGYIATLDGTSYASGEVTASSGTATLNLVAPVAGVYHIYVFRKTGDYASGFVQITVSEA